MTRLTKQGLSKFIAVTVALFMALSIVQISVFADSANNSFATARAIGVNETVTGRLEKTSDLNYYRFNLPGNGSIRVTYNFDKGVPYHFLTLYDSNRNKINEKRLTDIPYPFTTNKMRLPAGTYYILIDYTYGGTTSIEPYTLRVDYTDESGGPYEKEYNGSFATANELSDGQNITANITSTSDDDYYKFSVSGAEEVTLTYNYTAGDPYHYMAVYDSSNKKLYEKRLVNLPLPFTTSPIKVSSGTYYVKMEYTYGGTTGNEDYTLKVNGADSYTPPRPTTNPTPSPTPTSSFPKLTGTKTYKNTMSTYSVENYFTANFDRKTFIFDVNLGDEIATLNGTFSLTWPDHGEDGSVYLDCKINNANEYSDVSISNFGMTYDYGEEYTVYDGDPVGYLAMSWSATDKFVLTGSRPTATPKPTPSPSPSPSPKPTPPPSSGDAVSGFDAESIPVGVKLWWMPSSGGVGYRVYRSTSSGDEGISVTDFYIDSNEFMDVNVDANKTYYYTVRRVIKEARPFDGLPEELGPVSASMKVRTGSTILGGNASDSSRHKNFILMALDDPYMSVNGVRQEIDPGRGTSPIIKNSRTIVPIRAIVEAMGGSVGWNDYTRKIDLNYDSKSVVMTLNSKNLTVNGSSKPMDVAPESINSRTYVPIRFSAENLGCAVDWLNSTRQIVIVYY